MKNTGMRVRPCRVWKATVCLVFAAWFSFTIFHTALLRQIDDGSVNQFDHSLESRSDKQVAQSVEKATFAVAPGTKSAKTPEINEWLLSLRQAARQQLTEWHQEVVSSCSTNVATLSTAAFAKLHRVIIDPGRASGRLGGENLLEVLNQPETNEFWELKSGTFLVLCPNTTGRLINIAGDPDAIRPHPIYRQFLEASVALNRDEFASRSVSVESLDGPVLAVIRNEYANIYHTIATVYNAFANAAFFGFDPNEVTVLLIDGHPKGSLDHVWTTLFRRVIHMGQLKRPRLLADLVIVAEGHDSPMLRDRPSLPLLDQFREFILFKHHINVSEIDSPKPLTRSCTGSQVVLIWRRDYVAHPRNPNGRLVRKIANEVDVFEETRRAFPHLKLNVTGVAMAYLTVGQQLSLISQTRLLIGMHGAGLTHAMFLPKWSGLIEMFPDQWAQENYHFRSIAAWRGIAYEQWVSGSGDGDDPISIPAGTMTNLMRSALSKLGCQMIN